MPRPNRPRRAATLVEFLVACGAVCLLAGLSLPAVQRSRAAAARLSCQNNLRQVGTALHNYHASHGRLPPKQRKSAFGSDPDGLLSWQALVLPEMGEGVLWAASEAACRADRRPHRSPPHVGSVTVMKSYLCAADGRLAAPLYTARSGAAAFTSFVGVAGAPAPAGLALGVLGAGIGARLDDVRDGTSHTLLAGERPPPASLQAGRWYQKLYVLERFGGPDGAMSVNGPGVSPQDTGCAADRTRYGPGRVDNPCDRTHFWSLHGGGANFLFCDGSVRFLRYEADAILPALATRAGSRWSRCRSRRRSRAGEPAGRGFRITKSNGGPPPPPARP